MIIPASEARLTALALLYIDAVDRFSTTYDAARSNADLAGIDDLFDQITLAQRALLALLPPVIAPPCEVHNTSCADCLRCDVLRCVAPGEAIGAALARLGLRDPWLATD